ncbi:MAG: type II toxin-antitoxin system VapC family toxin [Gemmatimonadota bacterium]|nr:type II toxin-antitoxin system VapC family toxin [Gemmatimonadota bacterium]
MPDRPGSPTVLDTHVWIWVVEGDRTALSAPAIEAIERAAQEGMLRVSAISVWEVAMLEAKGRISLSRPLDDWVHAALHVPGVRLLPLSPEIAIGSTRLPGAPHGDPADRILMASARHLGGQLATCDRDILDYSAAGHLKVLDCLP